MTDSAAVVLLGEDLRDLGAAVAVRLVAELGGRVSRDDDAVIVQLPV